MANKSKQNSALDMDIEPYLRQAGKILMILFVVYLAHTAFFKMYNPEKRYLLKSTNGTFRTIEQLVREEYKNNPKFFIPDENEIKFKQNKICTFLAQKLADGEYYCQNLSQAPMYNFRIKNTKIEISGLEKPAVNTEGGLGKDFYIDIDGIKKGENYTGKDIYPLRLYVDGSMKGRVTPVNCNIKDMAEYGFTLPKTCGTGEGVNYMLTNMPFGFDVVQIGADKGKDRYLNRDVSFIMADCRSTGGELVAFDYCNDKFLSSLRTCDDDYVCSVTLAKK